MMMAQITERQARALAALVAELRDGWDVQGVYAAIGKARDRGSVEDVCHAAIRAALTPTNRTPAVIAMAGDHWAAPSSGLSSTSAVLGPRDPRCEVPGHEYEFAHNCRACRSEAIATEPTDDTPTLGISPEQAERNARWAAQAKAALTTPTDPTPRTPDGRELAAGTDRED